MKPILFCFCYLVFTVAVSAQTRYYTKNGNIRFESKAPLEDIEAVNKTVTCVLDKNSGQMQFSVVMRGFEFRKALMQEHFNENYVESHKYPKATFSGQITNLSEMDFTKPGKYTAKVKGSLVLHGVTRSIDGVGQINVDDEIILAISEFNIKLSDYSISIPAIVKDKVSNNVRVFIECRLTPL